MTRSAHITAAAGRLDYSSDVMLYRRDFRRYLHELEWASQWRESAFDNAEDALAHDASVIARLYDAGWNRYGWPLSAGGLGGDEKHRAVYYDELAVAMLPVPSQHWTLETLGPALLEFAPELAAAHLPSYLCGREWWGQGFSEPEAGSDLANLRTRAADDGANGLIINGQKIWTSQGSTATRLLVLVRTGANDSRHRGLSMVLVDTDTPGVTVRPIALASGRRELAEVFFDDVRVPRHRLVGRLGDGWAVAMYLMQYERGMYGYGVLTTGFTQLSRLRATMTEGRSSPADRQRFARVYVSAMAARARTAATVRRLAEGEQLGPASSIDKLLFSTAEKEINDLILDVRRHWMLAGCGAHLDGARADWWYTRAATIMGGTAEVQRGIIATRLLGLPKETP